MELNGNGLLRKINRNRISLNEFETNIHKTYYYFCIITNIIFLLTRIKYRTMMENYIYSDDEY
jgi:hypothetical protein